MCQARFSVVSPESPTNPRSQMSLFPVYGRGTCLASEWPRNTTSLSSSTLSAVPLMTQETHGLGVFLLLPKPVASHGASVSTV